MHDCLYEDTKMTIRYIKGYDINIADDLITFTTPPGFLIGAIKRLDPSVRKELIKELSKDLE